MQKITILYNVLESGAEADGVIEAEMDTQVTAEEIGGKLLNAGYEVGMCPITKQTLGKIDDIKADVIFNLVEWTGRDANYAVRAFKKLERCGMVFTGCGAKAFWENSDKVKMKQQMLSLGIPIPAGQEFKTGEEEMEKKLRFPLIVKLAREHCSVGIDQASVVENELELRKQVKRMLNFELGVVIEEYIAGREIHVTVVEKAGRVWVLPPAEILFKDGNDLLPVLTYKSKWDDSSGEFARLAVQAANLEGKMQEKVTRVAEKCFKGLGGRDYARIDIRLAGDRLWVLEINLNPEIDFTPQGGMGLSAELAGLNYETFLEVIVQNAYQRGWGERRLYDTTGV